MTWERVTSDIGRVTYELTQLSLVSAPRTGTVEELAELQQFLTDEERFLSVNITVGDLLPGLDVPGGLHHHPEILLQAAELVDRVGEAVVVGNAGNLVKATDALIFTSFS